MKQRGFTKILMTGGVLVFIALIGGYYLGTLGKNTPVKYTIVDSQTSQPTPTTVLPKTISQEEAVQIVENLPEVKDYKSRVKNSQVEYDHLNEDENKWVIHVYEQLSDHTATFNWYEIDKNTGEFSKMF